MRTAVQTQHLEVRPGGSTRVEISVTNTSDLIDGVRVVVDGLDQSWIRSADPIIRLFPDETGSVVLDIHAPDTAVAGNYLVVFRVESTVDFERYANHDLWLTVPPMRRASLSLVPSVITDGAKAVVEAAITNDGNATSTYRIEAVDPTRELHMVARPPAMILHPGQTLTSELTLSAPRPWFGHPTPRSVTVTAVGGDSDTSDIPPEPVSLTFNQRAVIPRGVITALILAGIIALWAVILLFVIRLTTSNDDVPKRLATSFFVGEDTIPIDKIAASVSGSVVSTTEGEGIPRISVEAERIFGVGDLRLMGAAGTDDDGNFVLDALLPGDYRLSFSADGYPTQFEHLRLDPDPPQEETDPGQPPPPRPQDEVRVELSGTLGVISGAIEVPPATDGAVQFTVTATPVEVDPPAEPEPEPGLFVQAPTTDQATPDTPSYQVTANDDGSFDIPGLPTPATYVVRAEVPGDDTFAPVEYEVRVEAGDTAQPNPVQPSAGPGSISGTVIEIVDGVPQPLGGVTVTVRSGDFVTETITPTRGTATFNVTGLETPADYVVTFSKDGFTGRTISLPLGAGDDVTEEAVVLVGGLGRVSGSVTDENGAPLGGVRVVVQGNGFVGESATVTTTSPTGSGGGVGSFLVSAVPVPGSYTVTFSADGYEPVTLPVAFDESAIPQQLPTVQMERRTGALTGVVVLTGGDGTIGFPDITITLDDGLTSRRISPTSSPPGAFSFDRIPPGSYSVEFRAGDDVLRTLFRRVEVGGITDASTTIVLPGAP